MIKIDDLTEKDIGRAVIYKNTYMSENKGVITDYNAYFIFVKYSSEKNSKATYPKYLFWEKEIDKLIRET